MNKYINVCIYDEIWIKIACIGCKEIGEIRYISMFTE